MFSNIWPNNISSRIEGTCNCFENHTLNRNVGLGNVMELQHMSNTMAHEVVTYQAAINIMISTRASWLITTSTHSIFNKNIQVCLYGMDIRPARFVLLFTTAGYYSVGVKQVSMSKESTCWEIRIPSSSCCANAKLMSPSTSLRDSWLSRSRESSWRFKWRCCASGSCCIAGFDLLFLLDIALIERGEREKRCVPLCLKFSLNSGDTTMTDALNSALYLPLCFCINNHPGYLIHSSCCEIRLQHGYHPSRYTLVFHPRRYLFNNSMVHH